MDEYCGYPVGNYLISEQREAPEPTPRAVVDETPCSWCGGDGYVTGSMPCPECTSKPRTLVAISEDRQWLVVLEPELEDKRATSVFSIWQWDVRDGHILKRAVMDTGQSAEDVLREWAEGQK